MIFERALSFLGHIVTCPFYPYHGLYKDEPPPSSSSHHFSLLSLQAQQHSGEISESTFRSEQRYDSLCFNINGGPQNPRSKHKSLSLFCCAHMQCLYICFDLDICSIGVAQPSDHPYRGSTWFHHPGSYRISRPIRIYKPRNTTGSLQVCSRTS